jgi:pimeloyl-ACP methyl ester carboxylesterase
MRRQTNTINWSTELPLAQGITFGESRTRPHIEQSTSTAMFANVDNLKLYYETHGEGDPILFIHGFPLSGELWHPTVERLDGWRCIVPDLRGHGRSEPAETASMARFAADLVGILQQLNESRPAVVVGLSMGGPIAFELFREYRPLVRALVLNDCRADPEDAAGRQRREEVASRVLHQGSGILAEEMIHKLMAPAAGSELRRHWTNLMAKTPPRGTAAAARALGERPDSRPTLPADRRSNAFDLRRATMKSPRPPSARKWPPPSPAPA